MKWLVIAILLVGCSANKRALKQVAKAKKDYDKAQKHIERAKELDPENIRDALFMAEVIYMPGRIDTAFVRDTLKQIDTVTVENERMRIQYINRFDTIQLEGECFTDTLEVKVPVVGPTMVKYQDRIPWWVWLVIALLLAWIFRVPQLIRKLTTGV